MNDNARRWVAALRSGRYLQARGRLQRGDAHCCLGVAADLYIRATGRGEWIAGADGWVFASDAGARREPKELPVPVRRWLGMPPRVLGYEDIPVVELMVANDAGMDFASVAGMIEAAASALFAGGCPAGPAGAATGAFGGVGGGIGPPRAADARTGRLAACAASPSQGPH